MSLQSWRLRLRGNHANGLNLNRTGRRSFETKLRCGPLARKCEAWERRTEGMRRSFVVVVGRTYRAFNLLHSSGVIFVMAHCIVQVAGVRSQLSSSSSASSSSSICCCCCDAGNDDGNYCNMQQLCAPSQRRIIKRHDVPLPSPARCYRHIA